MSVKLVKTKSDPCTKCGGTDFKVFNVSKACVNCCTYVFKELVRDIKNVRK